MSVSKCLAFVAHFYAKINDFSHSPLNIQQFAFQMAKLIFAKNACLIQVKLSENRQWHVSSGKTHQTNYVV